MKLSWLTAQQSWTSADIRRAQQSNARRPASCARALLAALLAGFMVAGPAPPAFAQEPQPGGTPPPGQQQERPPLPTPQSPEQNRPAQDPNAATQQPKPA